MKDLFIWWFSPKKSFSSIIKILIGLFIFCSFFDALIRNTVDLIDACANPPLYLGMSYLLLPVISTLFTKAIFWGGLFYLPYYIFRKRGEGKKKLLLPVSIVALIIGSFVAQGVYTKPGTIEITRTQLGTLEGRLGEMNKTGEFYTVREFSYDIAKLTDPLPDYVINEGEGFSKLVLFYKDCNKEWEELYKIPTDSEAARTRGLQTRDEWRDEHILEEAMLLFWGKYEKSVFTKGSPEAEQVTNLLLTWFDQYGIDKRMHPAFTDWTLSPK